MLCNSHSVVEKIQGYPQAKIEICNAEVLHRKFLHNPQGLWKNKIYVTVTTPGQGLAKNCGCILLRARCVLTHLPQQASSEQPPLAAALSKSE